MDDQQRRLMGFENLSGVGANNGQNALPLNINAQQSNMFQQQQQQYNNLLHQQYINNIDQVQALYSNPQMISQHMDMNSFQQPQLYAATLQLQQQLQQQQIQQQQQQQQSHHLQHQHPTQQHLQPHMQMHGRQQDQLSHQQHQQFLQHQLEQQQQLQHQQHQQQQLEQQHLLHQQQEQQKLELVKQRQAQADILRRQQAEALAAQAQQQEMLRMVEDRRQQEAESCQAESEEAKRQLEANAQYAAMLKMEQQQKEELKLQKELARKKQREEMYRQQMEQKRLEAEQQQQQEEQRQLEEKRRREEEERARVEMDMRRKQAEMEEAAREVANKIAGIPQPFHLSTLHSLTKLGYHVPFPEENMKKSAMLPIMNFGEHTMNSLLSVVDENVINEISNALLDVTVDISEIEMKSIDEEEFMDSEYAPPLCRQVNCHNIDNFTVEAAPGLDIEDIASTALADDQVEKMEMEAYGHAEGVNPSTSYQEHAPAVSMQTSAPSTDCDPQPSTSAQASETSAPLPSQVAGRDQSQLRKQMVSLGKQPKAQQNRKKKDMVESLFDSLTGYFDPTADRRKRQRVKTYSEEQQEKREIELVAQNVAQEAAMKGKEEDEQNKGKFFDRSSRKSRKRTQEDSPQERLFERESTPTEVLEQRNAEWRERQRRRAEKMRQRQMETNNESWNTDLMAQKDSLQRFGSIIDGIFDSIEDIENFELDEDAEIPQELLLDRSTLEMLRLEAQKLKSWKSTHKVQSDRLVKLLTILERNIREVINPDGSQAMYIPVEAVEDESDEAYRELFNEKVLRTADAACTVLLILTSPKMPKQVFIEDTIDRSVQLSKHFVHNIVIPTHDQGSAAKGKREVKKARLLSDSRPQVAKTIYARVCELLGCFAQLVKFEGVGESAVIQLISTCTPVFFVENIGELQVQAIKLLTAIFSQYPDHRTSVLLDLLNSLHRLPLTRNSRNSYRMNSDEWASNLTVLFLELVQSVIKVPKRKKASFDEEDEELVEFTSLNDGIVKDSFAQAEKMINYFINGFLSRCTAKSDEDYRKLFDNFLHDLLAALYKPEFPAAEMVMMQLGNLLVKYYRTRTNEMSLRVACLDYLGTITARLRKDRTMNAQVQNDERMSSVIKAIVYDEMEDPPEDVGDVDISHMSASERMRTLEQAIIDYLIDKKGLEDLTIEYAMRYYAGEWYNETTEDLESSKQRNRTLAKDLSPGDRELKKLERRLNKMVEKGNAMKNFLIKLVDRKHLKKRAQHVQRTGNVMIDSDAHWVVKYLAARREFSQAFTSYLKHILFGIRSETAVGLRTKATRCLTQIIEADSEVLLIPEVQEAVKSRTLDPNSAVREATIELIGKYLVQHPELFPKYYRIIVDRVRDTGIAVRKRAIRTLRELCEKDPTNERVPEMLCHIMRRISDEDTVKKLALEALQTFWFTPCRDNEIDVINQKLSTLCEVVEICNRSNFMENFDMLFSATFKSDDRSAFIAAQQMIDTLVSNILALDEAVGKEEKEAISGSEVYVEAGLRHHRNQTNLTASVRCLFLFSKACPKYLVKYVEILQPYLSVATGSNFDLSIVQQMASMMENVVPLLDHPSDSFLQNLDRQLAELIRNFGMAIIRSAVKCASVVYNRFKRVRPSIIDIFLTYLKWLNTAVVRSESTQYSTPEHSYPFVKRYLYTVGLLSRFFDMDQLLLEVPDAREAFCSSIFEKNFKRPPPDKYQLDQETPFLSSIFNMLVFFSRARDPKVRKTALDAIGNFTAEHSNFLERNEMKSMYMVLLETEDANYLELKIQTLQNLELFLEIEEEKSARVNAQWNKTKETQDLKDMELAFSGRASAIIQIYWNAVLNAVFSVSAQVRQAASKVVFMTLGQGLVTPGTSIPTLIAITTDEKSPVQVKMEAILKDIDLKYPTMVASRSIVGIRQSFRLHSVINPNQQFIRGFRCTPHEVHDKKIVLTPEGLPKYANDCQSNLSCLYSILRSNRQQRRSFLSMVLRLFQDDNREKLRVEELLYVADSLAMFPYQVADEPLYVIHQADTIISLCGQRVITEFKRILLPTGSHANDDEEFVADVLYRRFPDDKTKLFECLQSSQACFLLLYLKSFLIKFYGFNESRVQEYLPTENAKVYDKNLTRKNCLRFYPEIVMQGLHPDAVRERDTISGHIRIAHHMVYFRSMLLSLEKHDDEVEAESMMETDPADKTNDDIDSDS